MAARASFATGRQLHATQFRVIGAFCRLVVPYFAWATKRYRNIPIGERFEVLSLVGDITLRNGPA